MPSKATPADGEISTAADVLFEAGFLAGSLVDHAHGCLPNNITSTMKSKVVTCFGALVNLSEKIMDVDAFEWHDVCLTRRILNRVMRAISPGAHRHALREGLTLVRVEELAALNTSLHRLNAHILRRSDHVIEEILTHDGDMNYVITWEEFSSIYEAAIINRSRGNATKSLEHIDLLSRWLREEKIDVQMPPSEGSISGLTSFFPMTLSDDFEEAMNMLLDLNIAISRRSRYARAMGMAELQEKENDCFLDIAVRLPMFLLKDTAQVHPHGLLHLENVFRVCVYQAAWSVTRTIDDDEEKEFTTYNKTKLSAFTLLFYKILEKYVDASIDVEPWMKMLMRATFEQNKGVLISEIAPEIINPTSEETPEISKRLEDAQHSSDEDAQKLTKFGVFKKGLWDAITESGWQYEVDRPAYLKSEFRRVVIEDLVTRSKSITSDDSHEILIKLRRWLGDPTSLNPTGKKNSATMAAQIERTDEEAESLHLSHLPQGGINRAQVAVGLAYMQSIMRASYNASTASNAEHEDTGAFHGLNHFFVAKKDGKGALRMTPELIPGKLQFTMKHCVKEDAKIGLTDVEQRMQEAEQDKSSRTNSKIKKVYSRANLTRVNRQDGLMFIAKALGDLHEVLEDQLGSIDLQERIDRAARQCRLDEDIYLPDVKPPHVHELIYLAIDAANSPLRLLDLKYTEAADADEDTQRQVAIDALLRASMARLHALSIRTEITARILLEKPLREPYQSSAVLLTDQIRVLLRFFHTDWQFARDMHPSTTAHSYSHQIAFALNLFKNERRQRTIQDLEIPDLLQEEIRNEPALSYTIEYGTSNPEQSRALMTSSKNRLNFEANGVWDRMWSDLLAESITLHHEILDSAAAKEIVAQKVGSLDEGNEVTAFPTKQEAAERAMEVVERKTTREWILWARLATFPVCFVGRSLVSGTTTKDLNMSVVGRMAKPMLFNTVREAFCTEQE